MTKIITKNVFVALLFATGISLATETPSVELDKFAQEMGIGAESAEGSTDVGFDSIMAKIGAKKSENSYVTQNFVYTEIDGAYTAKNKAKIGSCPVGSVWSITATFDEEGGMYLTFNRPTNKACASLSSSFR